MNSIIQCLNVSMPFSDDLLSLAGSEGLGQMSGTLSNVFRGLRELEDSKKKGGPTNPKPLQQKLIARFPWYRGSQQHDSHELLRTLLGAVSDEATVSELAEREGEAKKKPAPGHPSSRIERCIWDSFRGHICATTLCWGCCRISARLDPFLDLSLELPAVSRQPSGPLGVNLTSASEPPPLPSGTDDVDDEEPATEADFREKKRGRRAEKEISVPQPKITSAPRRPMGAWGRAAEEEARVQEAHGLVAAVLQRVIERQDSEVLDGACQLLSGIFARALEAAKEADDAAAATDVEGSEGEPGIEVEVELTRAVKKTTQPWGFAWSESGREAGKMVIAAIVEESPLDRHNLKCRAIGEEEKLLCIGDRLLEVNFETDLKAMNKILKAENRISLRFARGGSGGKAAVQAAGRAESDDEEAEKQAKKAAEKRERRERFSADAARCYEALPEPLREVFGPEKGKCTSTQLSLDDCLQRFLITEALEDDFAPVYSCSECKKKAAEAGDSEDRGRRYASRRVWLWPSGLPPLFTLQLKRFRQYGSRFQKSIASVKLPALLDLSEFVLRGQDLDTLRPHLAAESALREGDGASSQLAEACATAQTLRYELYAICQHQGKSMGSGHYVAYVNSGPSLDEEQWFSISDSHVSATTREKVLDEEAYIAFYRREGLGAELAEAAAAAVVANAQEDRQLSEEEPDED